MATEDMVKATVNQWAKAFAEHGLTPQQIDKGIKACTSPFGPHKSWAPTPGEFIALCWPSADELGFPQAHDAYRAAMAQKSRVWGVPSWVNGEPVREKWSHFLIEHTMNVLGNRFFADTSERVAMQSFVKVYNEKVNQYLKNQANNSNSVDVKQLNEVKS